VDRGHADALPGLGDPGARAGRSPDEPRAHEEALQILLALQGTQPTDGSLAGQIEEAYLRLGKADAAADVARARVKVVPGLPDAYRTLARLEEGRGDLKAAQAALASARALAPQDAELHALSARLAARAGDIPAAIQATGARWN
jgi:predicted Zn-dependent protease